MWKALVWNPSSLQSCAHYTNAISKHVGQQKDLLEQNVPTPSNNANSPPFQANLHQFPHFHSVRNETLGPLLAAYALVDPMQCLGFRYSNPLLVLENYSANYGADCRTSIDR